MTELLSLSTKVLPTRKFLVDGEEFEILGIDHLSREDEALVSARLSKYQQTAGDLSIESDLKKGQALALSLRKQRTSLLSMLTTLPKEKCDGLPTREAVKLVEAAMEEMSRTDDGDEAEEESATDADD